jgi:serine/threonine-protein kinase
VIHRDLKAANLFLARTRSGEEESRVLDFGISKLADDEDAEGLTGTDAVFGTPNTMSPELLQGARHASPASDQYALGVVLYQCVTGRLPFRGGSVFATLQAIAKGEYARAREVVEAVPEGLDVAITRAMAYAPSDRHASVRAFGAALLPYASARGRVQWGASFADGAAVARPAESTAPELSFAETPSLPAGIEHDAAGASQPLPRSRALLAGVLALTAVALVAAVLLRRTPPARPAAHSPATVAATAVTTPVVPAPAPIAPVVETPAPAPAPPPQAPVAAAAVRPVRARATPTARDAGTPTRASIRQQDGRIFID